MEKTRLKELLTVHKQKFLSKTGLIRREVQQEISHFLPQREIILITGIRRSGKSSLMKLTCDELIAQGTPRANILYLNFDDERFIDFKITDFELMYETYLEMDNPTGRKYLFLDEIQNIKGWERWLNRLYEFEDVKIFVSGSNASVLGSEISTALTGRNRQITNWPFSFSEFLDFKSYSITEKDLYSRESRVELKRFFNEYFDLGGFPEAVKTGDISILEQYYRDILYRDLISRYSIRNITEIKELCLFLASNSGTVQSYKNIRELIGVKSIATVKNYLDALSDVFLFYFADMFSYSVKRRIYNPSKVYCVDTGLIRSISFSFSQNRGHLFENMVLLELLRRGKETYYWKSKKGREVDFVIKEGLKIAGAVQVCLSLADEKTRQREVQALIDAREELKPDELLIITDDEEAEIVVDDCTIKIVPLWKWLILRNIKVG